jgi:tetratricopeptide (TPR) repeat protein
MGEDVRFEKAQTQNFLGYNTSNFEETIDLLQGSVALFKELGDRYWTSHALFVLGHALLSGGKMADAEKNIQESIAYLIELGDRRLSTFVLGHHSLIYGRQGKFVKAQRIAQERMEIFEEIGDTSMIAVGQTELGECLQNLGEFDKAERLLEKAITVHKELENTIYFFGTLFDLCTTKLDLGKYVEAYNLSQAALDISSRSPQTGRGLAVVGWDTHKRRLGFSLTCLGMTSLALGKVAEAEDFLQRSQESLQGLPQITFSAYHHILLGIVHLRFNRPEQAKEHIRDSFQIGVKINSVLVHIPTFGAAALYLAYGGSLERAIEIYALASRYPLIAKSKWCQDVIEAPLNTMTASLSPEAIAAAQERGRERDMEAAVQELLNELG